MSEIVIKPIQETTQDYERMEDRIRDNWKKQLYEPLLSDIGAPDTVLKNSTDDLIDAIASGRIRFYRGQFTGRFNAAVSRELKRIGAKWNRKHGSFEIPLGSLPIEIKTSISASEDRWLRTVKKLDQTIRKMLPAKIADQCKLEDLFDMSITRVDKEIRDSVRSITVTPELSKKQRAKIAEEYTENMRLYIKEWTEKEIVTLRKTVQKSAMGGNRYETLVKQIQNRYDVSQNKAKFLARQETSILMSEFKKVRYQDAGSEEYIWGCVAGSKNHPVRPMHKRLEGKRFRWNTPPVVNMKGDRKNPGCDYGCRCFAKPVVKF